MKGIEISPVVNHLDSAIRRGMVPQDPFAVARLCCSKIVRESGRLNELRSSSGVHTRAKT